MWRNIFPRNPERIRRSFFKNFNTVMFRFFHCSTEVKIALFRSYCMHLYGTELWCRLRRGESKELSVAFHSALKRLCGLPKRSRNSPLCAELGILTLDRTLALSNLVLQEGVPLTEPAYTVYPEL